MDLDEIKIMIVMTESNLMTIPKKLKVNKG